MMRKLLFIVVCLTSVLPMIARAATVSFDASPVQIGKGDLIQVRVLLTSAVPTNTFSGALAYSHDLTPLSVSDGNTLVSMWLTRPALPTTGVIPFAGITPGGFSGSGGVLFSVVFRAMHAGTASVTIRDSRFLRNDGAGTDEPVSVVPLALAIGPAPYGGYREPDDTTPPEPFTLSLGKDTGLFEGRTYVAFQATDKSSGVDHYDVAESRVPPFLFRIFPLSWASSTSPYVLHDQAGTSAVYVRAVDRAGNMRLSVYPPQHAFTAKETFILAILVIVALLFGGGYLGRRSSHS